MTSRPSGGATSLPMLSNEVTKTVTLAPSSLTSHLLSTSHYHHPPTQLPKTLRATSQLFKPVYNHLLYRPYVVPTLGTPSPPLNNFVAVGTPKLNQKQSPLYNLPPNWQALLDRGTGHRSVAF